MSAGVDVFAELGEILGAVSAMIITVKPIF